MLDNARDIHVTLKYVIFTNRLCAVFMEWLYWLSKNMLQDFLYFEFIKAII